jgi:hypothetical protein
MDQKAPRSGKDAPEAPATTDPSLADRRAAFGAELRALRETSGLSIANLSQATRISVAFLTALETGDLDKLPGAVFGRGYLKAIAKTMNTSVDGLIEQYEQLWPKAAVTPSVLQVEIKNKPVVGRSEAVREGVADLAGMIAKRHGATIGKWTASVVVTALVALAGVKFGPDAWNAVRDLRLERSSGAASVLSAVRPGDGVTSGSASVAPKVAIVEPAPAVEATTDAAEPPTADDPSTINNIQTTGGDAPSAGAVPPPPPEVVSRSGSEADDTPSEPAKAEPASAEAPVAAPPAVQAPAPAAAEPAAATADAAKASGKRDQVLELTVTEPVTVRLVLDQGQTVARELAPSTYKFSFADHA